MSEHRGNFIQALREGAHMRNCMFRVLEERHAADFANGPAGVKYYARMLDTVRDANVPDAVEEFERRFFPLLDPDGSRARAAAAAVETTPKRRFDARWLAAGIAAAVLLVGTMLGLNAVPLPPKRPPAATAAATIPSATAEHSAAIADLPGTSDNLHPSELDGAKVPEVGPALAPQEPAVATQDTEE